jgi:hypothetical protein
MRAAFEAGVEAKGVERGLLDFPAIFAGGSAYWC